ncbi:MAG: hypothetical protein WAP74_04205 [Patescibacteria group bacterium]
MTKKKPARNVIKPFMPPTTVLAFDGVGDNALIIFKMERDDSYIPQQYLDTWNQMLAPVPPKSTKPRRKAKP